MPRYGHNRLHLIGKEFGNLIVIAAAPNTAAGKSRWVCMCICGNEHIAYGSHLRNGKTTSCGHSPVYCVHGHLRVPENIYPDGTCKECQKVRRSPEEYKSARNEESRVFYAKTASKYRKQTRERMAALKLEVLTYYSPEHVLGCCWENCTVTDIDMLSLDHINNDGAEHRRSLNIGAKGGEKLYRWAKKESFPDGFQTLCMNHQLKKQLLYLRSKTT
jgi:hypothetical protein